MDDQFNLDELHLIKKLQSDPSVLFLGQSYMALDTNKDLFLSKFNDKFKIDSNEITYNDIFKNQEGNKDSVRAWSQKLFENISLPTSMETISKFPWNHLFTSAIDNNLVRAFKNEVRSVQPIFNQSFKLIDPRSRTQLHETFLFGQIQYSDTDKAAPLSKLDFSKRKLIANLLLNRLPGDIITPKGVLIIEGWNPLNDWLSAEEFYSVLSLLGPSQIHIFSSNEAIESDEYIQDLIIKGKAKGYKESLASFIESAIFSGLLDLSKISTDENGFWVFFGDKRVKVPNALRNSVGKNAILLSKTTFETVKAPSENEYVQEFREFISYSPTVPRWEGYTLGLAFKRDFIDKVVKSIEQSNIVAFEFPLIVHGQASSGKTIGLGQVAYELVHNEKIKAAFLYIERSYKRLDENSLKNIDEYCLWAEENGADRTVIIYDGMHNYDFYYSILSNLTSRGRKVILIGSSYLEMDAINNKNFIEVSIELTQQEKQRFELFIKKVVNDRPALSNIISSQSNKNFLSVLYHYLPESKSTINDLIRREAKYYSDNIKQGSYQKADQSLIIKDLLEELGFKESDDNNIFNEEIVIGGENAKIATQFINLIMVIGKHGLSIPFELLLRVLGTDSIKADFFNYIPNTDLIRWYEDHNGNIDIGPRTQLEALIYTYSLGGVTTEIEYIKKILKEIRDSYHSTQEDKEVEFATQLLQYLKQSGTQYRKYIYEYADILSSLRMSKQAVHPRLMLQEASLLQEAVKEKDFLPINKTPIEILDLAESVIREAIALDNSPKSPTYIYLKVELASIMGSKAVESKNNVVESKALFQDARDEILSFSFSTQNYHALDILLWTIRDQAKITVNKSELGKLFAEAEHYLQFGAEEGIALAFQEDFSKRKYEIGQVFNSFELSEDAFNELLLSGSKAGYFLRARQLLGGVEIYSNITYSENDISKINDSLKYLVKYFNEIKYDSQCLYLLLKLWWLSKTMKPIFNTERNTLKFDQTDWTYLLEITNLLLENSNVYISPTAKYLKAISQFHTSDYNGAIETFRELSDQTDRTNIGSRRIKKYYLSSNIDGTAKPYFGIMESDLNFRNSSAFVVVDGLGKKIKCFYTDFRRTLTKDEAIDFTIAFNFIGPVAIPINR
jgi:hypothetical protein